LLCLGQEIEELASKPLRGREALKKKRTINSGVESAKRIETMKRPVCLPQIVYCSELSPGKVDEVLGHRATKCTMAIQWRPQPN